MQACALSIAILGLVLGADPKAEALKKEHESLQGTWIEESITIDGRPFYYVMNGERVSGHKLILEPDGKARVIIQKKIHEGTYQLNISRKPRELDLTMKSYTGITEPAPGIYEIKEGKLRLILGFPSKRYIFIGNEIQEENIPPKRPQDFDDDTELLMTFVREKK